MLMQLLLRLLIALRRVVIVLVSAVVFIAAVHFPYDVDAPLTREQMDAAQKYYTEAYARPRPDKQEVSEYQTEYIRVAEAAAKEFQIEGKVRAFVRRFDLADKPVLEIGSGRGYLQDLATNYTYTGLDISPTVARFYHKKFVLGSATSHRNCKVATVINDFVEYWAAARLLISGGNPYSPAELLKTQQAIGWSEPTALLMWNPPWTFWAAPGFLLVYLLLRQKLQPLPSAAS